MNDFSRRPGERFNRGRIATNTGAGAAPAATWLSILGALAWWVRPNMGYTMGTGVAAWADQSGNGVNFLQGVGTAQPALLPAALDGYSAVLGDGSNDVISAAWARVAPSVQPFYVRTILAQVSWTNLDYSIGDYNGVVGFVEVQRVASPGMEMYNVGTTPGNNAAGTIGSYFRHEMQFTGTAANYHKIGATSLTGVSAGDNAGGGTIGLFNSGAGIAGRYGNVAIVEAAIYLGTPSAPTRAALDALDAAKYPSAGF